MSQVDFEMLINMIVSKIMKVDANFRQAISVKERLALTLHLLATGDSYRDAQCTQVDWATQRKHTHLRGKEHYQI